MIQSILKPYNEFSCMKVSTTGFLVENLATGLEMRYIVFFLCPVNPSLEFGGYKRTVERRFLSRSASHSRIFVCISVFINFSFFRYDSFFLKLLQICPYLSQAHTLCPLALQYAELSPKSEAFLQFRHLTYTISGLTFFAIFKMDCYPLQCYYLIWE